MTVYTNEVLRGVLDDLEHHLIGPDGAPSRAQARLLRRLLSEDLGDEPANDRIRALLARADEDRSNACP